MLSRALVLLPGRSPRELRLPLPVLVVAVFCLLLPGTFSVASGHNRSLHAARAGNSTYFAGNLTLAGVPAPAGMQLVAKSDGAVCSTTTTSSIGKYAIAVPGSCSRLGMTVTFWVNDLPVSTGSSAYHGYVVALNLTSPG